jgi:hypothetical protein
MSHNNRIWVGVIAVLVVVVGVTLWFQRTTSKDARIPRDVGTTSTPTSKDSLNTPNHELPRTERYVSETFGVAFNFSPIDVTVNGEEFPPTESGDRIYIGGPSGQWVQVFPKEPSQSFENAIRERFLSGIDPNTCYVQSATYEWLAGVPNVSGAVISFPISTNETEPWWSNGEKCGNYATTNGIAYFYYDARFPDRFYYFSIGQYGIPSGVQSSSPNKLVAWQETFSVLK